MKTRTFSILATLAIAIAFALPPAGGAEKKGGREYTTDISGEAGEKFLRLEEKNGFHALEEVFFMLDPSLQNSNSECYKALKEINEFKTLFNVEKRKPVLLPTIELIFNEFFRLICNNPKPWKNLEDLIQQDFQGEMKPLVTISVIFFQEKDSTLSCRVDLRLFKIRVDEVKLYDVKPDEVKPDEVKGVKKGNLGYCELIFCDSSTGCVPLGKSGFTAMDAVKAVLIDTLKDRLAVSFAMNPRFNPKDVTRAKQSYILGPSVTIVLESVDQTSTDQTSTDRTSTDQKKD